MLGICMLHFFFGLSLCSCATAPPTVCSMYYRVYCSFLQTSFLSLLVSDEVGFLSGTSQPWLMPPSLIQLQPGRSGLIYFERFVPSKSDLINLKTIWWWRCRTTSEQKHKQDGTWMADTSVRGKVWIINLMWYFSLDLIINLHFKIYGFQPNSNLCREDWWGEKENFVFILTWGITMRTILHIYVFIFTFAGKLNLGIMSWYERKKRRCLINTWNVH